MGVNYDIIIKEIIGEIIIAISYFKDKFKQLGFRIFDNEEQMQKFLERAVKSEDVLNSLITNRLTKLKDKI